MKVSAAQLCLILHRPVYYSLSGSSVHGSSPGKNTGVGYHSLLQEIFTTQGLNPGLLHSRRILFFFWFIFISWRLITLQYCSGFCHTLTWISHGFTCVPHPDPPSHLPLYPIPLSLPSAPGLLFTIWAIREAQKDICLNFMHWKNEYC